MRTNKIHLNKHIIIYSLNIFFLQVNEDMEEDGENSGEFSLAVVDVQSAALAQAATALLDTQVIMI